ncbi:WD40 repeat-like protein [Mycena venus]|uniref:WD40 repeat-like protein n=1 Tax=Mycena venus TaxID=2733690 RepID=A0A8H7CRL8_9AGAR|nr:WD40 repeat-like protein [Mycena venus]
MPESDSSGRTKTKTLRIKISKIQADGVPIVPFRTGRFFIKIQVNDDTATTAIAVAASGWVSWKDELHFDIPLPSTMTLTLLATHRVRSESILGWYQRKIEAGACGPIRCQLNKTGTPPTDVSFYVDLLPSDAPCASDRRAGKSRGSEIRDVGAGIHVAMRAALCPVHLQGAELQTKHAVWFEPDLTTMVSDGLNLGEVDGLPEFLSLLLEHVERFTKLISRFSEIHPYAKFACSVLTMAQKAVIAQKERDHRLRQLIQVTSEVFLFLNDLKVSALEGHRQTIKLLTLQTTECAYFIRDYTKQKSFIGRTGSSLLSGRAMDAKIAEYEKKFEDLKAAFRNGSALNTEIVVLRIADQVDRIVTAAELDDLPYASARFDLGKQCRGGTREDVLEQIFAWINQSDPDTPRVLLLNSRPGAGKSAIAHTVSRRLNELRRLGSSFFFLREQPERSPEKLFTTIARDLADLDPEWKEALRQAVGLRALRKTPSIREQFEEFILKPAQRPSVYFGPVVIVIDALDAVADPDARQTLISLLSSRTAELPNNFRIFITARTEPDICAAFRNREGIAWWPMDTGIDRESNMKDIAEFFDNELAGVVGSRWSDKLCHKLVRKSEGDFGWATFACTFIKHNGGRIKSPYDRMSRLLWKPKGATAAQLEAEESDSESDGFLHDRIRDKLHHIRSHSVFDNLWHPHPHHRYSDAVNAVPSFPVPWRHPTPPHGEGPPGPWLTRFPDANLHDTAQFVDEPLHY